MSESKTPSSASRVRSVPTLALLCKEVIASKIERYPPECLGILSEAEWDAIVKRRHRKTAPKHGSAAGKVGCTGNVITNSITSKTGGLDGSGRLVPSISAQIMTAVEEACPHLRCSSVADDLVWKDCVEYKFRTGGPSRPRAFHCPWDLLVSRLKKSGEDLMELLKPPVENSSATEDTEDDGTSVGASLLRKRERILDISIKTLSDAPMSVPLLTSSGVGKAVQKVIKQCTKLRLKEEEVPWYIVDMWSRSRAEGMSPASPGRMHSRSALISPLEQLERLLQGWKNVASSSGVVLSKNNGDSVEDCSGRNKKTSAEQHGKDMKVLQTCKEWRDIYIALVDRESKMMANHGKMMRKIRENLNTDRPKISQINLKTASKRNRQDAILGGSRGLRAMTAAASANRGMSVSPSLSKMQQLRKETAIVASRQVPVGVATKQPHPSGQRNPTRFGFSVANAKTMQRKTAAGSFGASVASATSRVGSNGSKRKMPSGQRSVALRGGKKAKPSSMSGSGVFASIQHKKEKAAKRAYIEDRKRSSGHMKSFRR
mmetsp:Transcript_2197/g.5846  ORF Transcript_2197/g.5846 Transcript_2197/m.5846 type:complete len:544 (-) Transcript_2197:214-1845(-)